MKGPPSRRGTARLLAWLVPLATAAASTACGSSFGTEAGGLDEAGVEAGPPTDGGVDAAEAAADASVGDASVSPFGCADGTREDFRDASSIAACEGAWGVPGVLDVPPSCQRRGGNDGDAGTAAGCNAQDLCAAGWHVCRSAVDVFIHGGGNKGPCARDVGPSGDVAYVTMQPSSGALVCDVGPDSGGLDDVFGCGTYPQAPTSATCDGLNVALTFEGHPSSFNITDSLKERAVVRKAQGPGGVLCCTD